MPIDTPDKYYVFTRLYMLLEAIYMYSNLVKYVKYIAIEII